MRPYKGSRGLRQAEGTSVTSIFVLPAQSGVTIHERRASARFQRAMAGLGQARSWIDIYLDQRREAEKRYGRVVIETVAAATAYPKIDRDEGLALLDWWKERLDGMVGTAQATGYFISPKAGSLSDNEKIDLRKFVDARAGLEDRPSWDRPEIRAMWDTAQLAATRLSASASVAAQAAGNTWLRAFKESVEDIVGNGADPFGVGAFFKKFRVVLIAGSVIVGGLVVLNVWQSARRALPLRKEGT